MQYFLVCVINMLPTARDAVTKFVSMILMQLARLDKNIRQQMCD